MNYLLLIVSVTSLTSAHNIVTPPRYPGIVYSGHAGAKVHVDFHIDPLCPDSAEAWPGITQMADHYGPDNVRLNVQIFPLPYHSNAFYISKAAYVIHALTNGTRTLDWLLEFLNGENYKNFWDSRYLTKSDLDLLNSFRTIATNMDMGIDVDEFISLTNRSNYNPYERYARGNWKFSASQGVAATPTFFVNGVFQPQILQAWGLPEWRAYMDPLVQPHEFDRGFADEFTSQDP